MKSKIYKILGVALVVVLLASLTISLSGPAGAAVSSKLKFAKLNLQQVEDWGVPGSEGDYWCTPNTNVGVIHTSLGGDLFAALYGPFNPQLMKSVDEGYAWKMMDNFAAIADGSSIVKIVTSPEYDVNGGDETVFVATRFFVYQSVDGGETWAVMPVGWPGGEHIEDMDVTMDDKGRLTVMVCTATWGPADAGDVYIYGSKTLNWVAQQITDGVPGFNPVDVRAGGFSPFFADDEFFAAVVQNDILEAGAPGSQVQFAITPTIDANPAPWGGTYGVARIRDADDVGFECDAAFLAYPDNFNAGGIDNNCLFVGFYEGPTGNGYLGGERGDVYKITTVEGPFSIAQDLDMRGEVSTTHPTATNITNIDVIGDAPDCHILAGTDWIDFASSPYYFLVYRSEDGGDNWMPSFKSPTGGDLGPGVYGNANTQVLFAYDYLQSGICYAGTMGDETSGFHRGINNGSSFNGISLIDYGDDGVGNPGYAVAWVSATGYNAANTIHMVTQFSDGQNYDPSGAVWQTTNGGENWERIFGYASPFVDPRIGQVWRIGESSIFTVNFGAETVWRSSDMGETWMKKITNNKPGGLSAVSFVSETELWFGFGDGSIWWSTNTGATWDKPEENEITMPVLVILPMGPNVLVSTFGGIYFSSDAGENIERIGAAGEPGPGFGMSFPDVAFGENSYVYSTSPWFLGGAADDGVWRAEVDFADPGESEWVRIDDNQDATGLPIEYDESTVAAGSMPLPFPPSGILYVIDGAPVDTNDVAGGIWRCTNPSADVDGVVPPYFEKENKGLDGDGAGPGADDVLLFLSFDLFPTVLFCGNVAAANYWEQVVLFTDTLDVGPPLFDPPDAATGVGLLPEWEVYPEVILSWEGMAGATSYQYQLAIDPDFRTRVNVPDNGFTDSLASAPLDLQPNTKYYWRARVAAESTLIGAPLISPWSETWSFKTAIGAAMARPDLEAPWPGEPDVPLSPTFEWSGIEWAVTYEYELAVDPATTPDGYFTSPLVSMTGATALVSTAWKCDIALDYETRYYWHVKAIGVDTDTPWSDVGTFTTIGPPAPPGPPPEEIVIPPVQEITPAWIWAIVIIGAILVIAVIVLIVTTRRVP